MLTAAVPRPPAEAGIDLADWTGKVVRRFVQERCAVTLARGGCLNDLHRLGCVVRRPTKRLLKADEAKREVFVGQSAARRTEAETTGATHVFVDEAHFSADADLRGEWVLKGAPALVDSTSPRDAEKASYDAAVCAETGEVGAMPLAGNRTAETSASFLTQLRAHHAAPLVVFWDNAPAHGGAPLRAYLPTPDLRLRLVRLPADSPAFTAAEPLWDGVRDAVTANTCFGTAVRVRAHLDPFFAGRAGRADEVKRRCRTVLQARAAARDALTAATAILQHARRTTHTDADPSLALV